MESIIKTYNWNDMSQWISINSTRYIYLKNNLIKPVFPMLRESDQKLLLDSLTLVINLIYIKFNFFENDKKDGEILWTQFIQNNLLDLKALLFAMLPYINDDEKDDKKHKLKNLEDLYLETGKNGSYLYTNSQYNRCIRYIDHNKEISIEKRPFIKEYLVDHLELILFSIEAVANKLYVNWVDVLPIKMNDYVNTKLYRDTFKKIIGKVEVQDTGQITTRDEPLEQVNMINNYIDAGPGLSYQDCYNVISNHLYNEIKNFKWLIFDIVIVDRPVSYINYLRTRIDFDSIIDDNLMWSQLSHDKVNKFTNQWKQFMASSSINDNTVLHNFYFYFAKSHKNSKRLRQQGKLTLEKISIGEDDEIGEDQRVTKEQTKNAKKGMANVPVEEIYLFMYDQLNEFRKTWYFYFICTKKEIYITKAENYNIYITPKNIYNYCKSMIHKVIEYEGTKKRIFAQLPKHWQSLEPRNINIILIRLLDIEHAKNNWSRANWFNINKYIKNVYPNFQEEELPDINKTMHYLIRAKLVDVIFESLICHGLLSDFSPNKNITDILISKGDVSRQRRELKERLFKGKSTTDHATEAYYFITGQTYDKLSPPFFDFQSPDKNDEQNWMFGYPLNWISQINMYHHYINNRVMYITGATGIGKSTQVPKLLMYAQKMLDYNSNGKIVCTQPRVTPTTGISNQISNELGVPIETPNDLYDRPMPSQNYYVQYKYQEGKHEDRKANSFLKIVTDGTLLTDLKKSPFVTTPTPDTQAFDYENKPIDWQRIYSAKNIYDIIIVDEAHEHNHNMDIILTLARDSAYINNSIKLIIMSATMDDDEPRYRRYYRAINDNRAYPLSAFIKHQGHDRANMDRRIHISPPGGTTRFEIKKIYLPKEESDLITLNNFLSEGIKKTIEVVKSTTSGNILFFVTGQKDILQAVEEINKSTPADTIAFGFFSELNEYMKKFVVKIHSLLPHYTRYKEDWLMDEKAVARRVAPGTYKRAIIVATNVAEASVTFRNLSYIVDTGYAKTVSYDPLEGIQKTSTLPISQSSSTQRAGRVGRLAPGTVYFMYSEEKIINNETWYKITEINIKDVIVDLLKSKENDSFIITSENDINNIDKLNEFATMEEDGIDLDDIFYKVLYNPRPYLNIIKNRYMYINNINDSDNVYTYYGITNAEYPDIFSIRANLMQYMILNHDDYEYQRLHTCFNSRAYTGYDDFMLEDADLSFYLIHPDENVIERNMYTGKMVSLKYSERVAGSYYYLLLKNNDFPIDKATKFDMFDFAKINYDNFLLLKFDLAMRDAKLQMMVTDIPTNQIDPKIKYSKNQVKPHLAQYVDEYYQIMEQIIKCRDKTTIRAYMLTMMDKFKSMISIEVLNKYNNILWYTYAIPYQIENDVLAIMLLIQICPEISNWIDPLRKKEVEKIFDIHSTKRGDIYFLWKLWNEIKKIITTENLLASTEINIKMATEFKTYKENFRRGMKIPLDQALTFNKLYKSGKLNINDEFYYYVDQMTLDSQEASPTIVDRINILAKQNGLDASKIQEFLTSYLGFLFKLNRNIWKNQYKLETDFEEEGEEIEIDLILWARKKLFLPGIYWGPHYEKTEWDIIFESYLRVFSINLVKKEINYYLKITNGMAFTFDFVSDRVKIEKTFLKDKTEFIIYHNDKITEEDNNIVYLTPVLFKWVAELNPIYFYFYLFSEQTQKLLKNRQSDKYVNNALAIIKNNKMLFNFNALISYLDQTDNKYMSKLIREHINEYKYKLND